MSFSFRHDVHVARDRVRRRHRTIFTAREKAVQNALLCRVNLGDRFVKSFSLIKNQVKSQEQGCRHRGNGSVLIDRNVDLLLLQLKTPKRWTDWTDAHNVRNSNAKIDNLIKISLPSSCSLHHRRFLLQMPAKR